MKTSDTEICVADDCFQAVFARSLCAMHYSRWLRHGEHTFTPISKNERFWLKVDASKGAESCWTWMGGKTQAGYGRFGKSEPHYAHRIAWELTNGKIPKGLVVRHKCDNPPCVNPNHLLLGTQKENAEDRDSRGRNSKVKLNKEQIVELRRRFQAGETSRILAKEFGLSLSGAYHIGKGLRCKFV